MSDIMNKTTYGRAALEKLSPVAENFIIYAAGWLGDKPGEWTVMEVTGAQFRAAKTGKNKGKLVIPIQGTKRTAFVTKDEMNRYEALENES